MYNDNNDIIMIMCFRINLYKYNSSCFLACWGALNFLPFFFFINNFSLPSSTNVHSSNITHRKPDIKTSGQWRKHDLFLNLLKRWMFYRFFFRMQKWGKCTTIFNIASVFFCLQFNFLLQAVPDIISAYWIFGNVN